MKQSYLPFFLLLIIIVSVGCVNEEVEFGAKVSKNQATISSEKYSIGDSITKVSTGWHISKKEYISGLVNYTLSDDEICWTVDDSFKEKNKSKINGKLKNKTNWNFSDEIDLLDKVPMKDSDGKLKKKLDFTKDGCMAINKFDKKFSIGFNTTEFIYNSVEIQMQLVDHTYECLVDCYSIYDMTVNDTITTSMLTAMFNDTFGSIRYINHSFVFIENITTESYTVTHDEYPCWNEANETYNICAENFTVITNNYTRLKEVEPHPFVGTMRVKLKVIKSINDTVDAAVCVGQVCFPEWAWYSSSWKSYSTLTIPGAWANGTYLLSNTTFFAAMNCTSDLRDFRVLYNNASTVPLWIENATQKRVWIFAQANTTVDAYCNNSAATSSSDGYHTFKFFRNISNCQEGWTNATNRVMKDIPAQSLCWIDMDPLSTETFGYYSTGTMHVPIELRFKFSTSTVGSTGRALMTVGEQPHYSGTTFYYSFIWLSGAYQVYDAGSGAVYSGALVSKFYISSSKMNATKPRITLYNATQSILGQRNGTGFNAGTPDELKNLAFDDGTGGTGYTQDIYFPWMFVRYIQANMSEPVIRYSAPTTESNATTVTMNVSIWNSTKWTTWNETYSMRFVCGLDESDCAATNQGPSQSIVNVTVNSSTSTSLQAKLNVSYTGTGVDIKCHNSSSSASAIILNTTYQQISSASKTVGEAYNIWCWMDVASSITSPPRNFNMTFKVS